MHVPKSNLVAAIFGAALLAACGSANNGLPSSTSMSGAAQIVAPRSNERSRSRLETSFREPRTASGFRSLYSFKNGGNPQAGLIAINSLLYGTTTTGGFGSSPRGTVFRIGTSGKEKVIHSFDGASDGAIPLASLIAVNTDLYGTTARGGTGCNSGNTPGCGTVFEVSASGTERVLHRFNSRKRDGLFPFADLTALNGALYGTTSGGGTDNFGTVFKIGPRGTGYKSLYSFKGGADGEHPYAGLIAVNGTLYGTTLDATVFAVTTSGKERVLHRFKGGMDGAGPVANLAYLDGMLYGTTSSGGGYSGSGCKGLSCGTVFEVSTSGKEHVLYRFKGGMDGATPFAGLTVLHGKLYGTTFAGGGAKCSYQVPGCGTAFEVSTSGKERVLYSFHGADGAQPSAGLIALNGALYGTTYSGGTNGYGTVFALTP